MKIQSLQPEIVQALESMAEIIRQHGGYIHPDLTVQQRSEQLSLSCAAGNEGDYLLVVPDALFIPVTDLDWHENAGQLAYRGETAYLSPAQRQLLDGMVRIYNATGKIPNVAERLPEQVIEDDPALLAWMRRARPCFELSAQNAARRFIQTRLYVDDDSTPATGYLMPIIDLINHHPYAPQYERSADGYWRIRLHRSVPDSAQCFVRYTKADSLSLALLHGYFERHTRHIASVDCRLISRELGPIRIVGTHASRQRINAPRILHDEETLTLQDIVLEKPALTGLRTLLGLALRSRLHMLEQAEAERQASELIDQLIDANIRNYSELQNLCREAMADFPLRPLFGQVAGHQLALLADMRSA